MPMYRIVSFFKNVAYTIMGTVWLLITVYVNAVAFLLAVMADKAFKLLGTSLTVDGLLHDFEHALQSRYDAYKHSVENFHLKNIKLPF